MNYVKNIKNNILSEAVGKGLVIGGVIALLINLFLMFLRLNPQLTVSILLSGAIILACALIAWLLNLRKLSAVSRRVRSLENVSGSIDRDVIHQLSRNTAMGDTWLITRNKTKYRFWTKDILKSLTLTSNNPAAKQAVLELHTKDGRTEKVIVAKSPQLEEKIAQWMYVPDDVNDLTLGQM